MGDVVSYDAATGLAEIVVKNRFQVGDRLEIVHPEGNQELLLERMENIEGGTVSSAPGSGHRVRIPVGRNLERGLVTRFL